MMIANMPKSKQIPSKELASISSLKVEGSTLARLSTSNKQNLNQVDLIQVVHVYVRGNFIFFTHQGNEGSWNYELNDEVTVDAHPKPCPTLDSPESQGACIDGLIFSFHGSKHCIHLQKISGGNLKELYFVLCKKTIYFWDPSSDYSKKRMFGNSPYKFFQVHGAITSEPYILKAINQKKLVQDTKKSFDLEVQAHRKVKHPNIVNLEKLFRTHNSVYMVFQFTKQYSLKEYIQLSGYPTYEGKKYILRAILEAVSCLHAQDLIHGNLNFSSIRFAPSPDQSSLIVKIGNFGSIEQESTKISDLKQIGWLFLHLLCEQFIQADPSDIDFKYFPQDSSLWGLQEISCAESLLSFLFNPPNQETKHLLSHPYINQIPNTSQTPLKKLKQTTH